MPMTLEQLTNQLSAVESTEGIYEGIGLSEIPLLEQLLQHQEPWMAARAVFALSRVSGDEAITILTRSVNDPRHEVRVSVAASLGNLTPSDANSILLALLEDGNLGVRKFAIRAVSGAHNDAVHAKLKDIEVQDAAPFIRDLAKSKLRGLNVTGE